MVTMVTWPRTDLPPTQTVVRWLAAKIGVYLGFCILKTTGDILCASVLTKRPCHIDRDHLPVLAAQWYCKGPNSYQMTVTYRNNTCTFTNFCRVLTLTSYMYFCSQVHPNDASLAKHSSPSSILSMSLNNVCCISPNIKGFTKWTLRCHIHVDLDLLFNCNHFLQFYGISH